MAKGSAASIPGLLCFMTGGYLIWCGVTNRSPIPTLIDIVKRQPISPAGTIRGAVDSAGKATAGLGDAAKAGLGKLEQVPGGLVPGGPLQIPGTGKGVKPTPGGGWTWGV